MSTADITVVPTGGTSSVNLADLAATVALLQARPSPPTPALVVVSNSPYGAPSMSENSGFWTFHVAKATGVIETMQFYLDGSASPAGYPTQSYTTVPDGMIAMQLPWTNGFLLTGQHTVEIKAATTGASVSYTISQP